MKLTTFIRLCLTILWTYAIYTETGIWTALAMFLSFATIEMLNKEVFRKK